jgi:hypothetical protein
VVTVLEKGHYALSHDSAAHQNMGEAPSTDCHRWRTHGFNAEQIRSDARKRLAAPSVGRVATSRQTSTFDRIFMVVTASRLPSWRQALLIAQPDTVLRWHRDLFKYVWRRKSRQLRGYPPLNPEIVALIQQMATANRLWGAERIRGELRKLGWQVGKGTVLK